MSTTAQRLASEIGREFPSAEPEDRVYARKVARYLLGIDHRKPALYDDVVIDQVKIMLRRRGYHPPSELGLPWRATCSS